MLRWTTAQGSTDIPGFHGEVAAESPELAFQKKYVWGTLGSIVVVGNQSTRTLRSEIWLSDDTWTTPDLLYTFLDQTLEPLVGGYGSLEIVLDQDGFYPITGPQTFDGLLFLPYELVNFNGQRMPGLIRDQAGCLYRSGPNAGQKTYTQFLMLNFLQTVPGRTVNPGP